MGTVKLARLHGWCSLCDNPITVGAAIARHPRNGGQAWGHAECVAEWRDRRGGARRTD
jgi:hypothetical protein